MLEAPHAADLLSCAVETIRRDILPALPPEQRYTALMIARAIAVARAEMVQRDQVTREETAELEAFLGNSHQAPAGDPEEGLRELNRRLATAIRAGDLDPGAPGRSRALDLLSAMVGRRLAASQPKG
jgi:DNA-binding transcriptional regulator YdaS (Cro superfamily)